MSARDSDTQMKRSQSGVAPAGASDEGTTRRSGRPRGLKLTKEVPVYLTPEGEQQARELAARRKMPLAKLFRTLLEEEVARVRRRDAFERSLDQLTEADAREYVEAIHNDDDWLAAQGGG